MIPRSRRRVRLGAGAVLLALVLAGCGSDAEGSIPGENPRTVAGGGHRYSFGDDTTRAQYPNPCSFIPARSVSALVGVPVTARRGPLACSYPAKRVAVPALVVQVRNIGADAGTKYTFALQQTRGARTGVPRVGGDAVRFQSGRTTRIDALVANVYFRIQVNAVTGKPPDVARAQRIATRAAQLVSAQLG